VAAGFTPLQALQTATLNPAQFYNKLDEYGTVQPGRVADLLLLKANPLTDIANTRSITAVIADGRYLSQGDLNRLRSRLRRSAVMK
jgi:imidazolonepropionase-like amidohydrolase